MGRGTVPRFPPLSQSWAQESAPAASQETSTQQQEDPRGIRTREFLGLGRMPDAKMAAEGAKIFASTCGFCHGENARGASGPDLLRSPVVLDDNQGELIGQTVHEGRPAKGMPAFPSLTSRAIARYRGISPSASGAGSEPGNLQSAERGNRKCQGRRGLFQRRRKMQYLPLRHW